MLGEDGVLYGLLRFNKAEYQRKWKPQSLIRVALAAGGL